MTHFSTETLHQDRGRFITDFLAAVVFQLFAEFHPFWQRLVILDK